jgi:hypothetical protein
MGESTALLCCEKLSHVISHSVELNEKYLRMPTREDARRVSSLHERIHGIIGMLGSLDCMHVPWKNCPKAWQGQFVCGKIGKPTIVLEGLADYNLWFWHVAFGYPGSMNDINVWDNSPLHKAYVNGAFSSIDFEFHIGGSRFTKLWVLVDGIYPKLARFVQTISVPLGRQWKQFVAWQESAQKDIERAFGVLQGKFHVVRYPIQKWDLQRIQEIVTTCIIFHNMMVEKRVNEGDEEDINFYDICNPIDDSVLDNEQEEVEAHDAEVEHRVRVVSVLRENGEIHHDKLSVERFRHMELLPQRMRVIEQRWAHLYNKEEHFRLQHAIAKELGERAT